MKSAAKVGVLLIIFVVLIVASFGILGRNLFLHKHKTIYVQMKDAGGLVEGTKVLMAGVQIGTVQKVSLVGPRNAVLTLSIVNRVQIPTGSQAVIPGSLVGFGDSTLEIAAPSTYTSFLPDKATISGGKAGPLDAILPDGGKALYGNINESLRAVRTLLQDQGLQKNFKQLLTSANQTLIASQASLHRFDLLADRANGLIASNQGNLQSMVASMKGTLQQVQYTAGSVAQFVREGKLQHGTTQILDRAVRIEGQASALVARLDKIAGDPGLKRDIDATVHNAAEATSRAPKVVDNAEKITANIADITERSKQLPDTLNEVALKATKLEDRLSSLLDKLNGVKSPNTSGLRDFRTELDLTRESNPGYWRTDLNVTYPLHEGYVTFGLYDAFESDKLNLQLARSFGKSLDLRYGIYASKPAIGVDFLINRKLSARTDLWNINAPELDARLRYDFGGGVVGWAGVDRVFQRASPSIGIGVVR